MIPVMPDDREGSPVIMAADQPQYLPLPAHYYGGRVITRWQLNENERRAILDGACIDLTLVTFGQPLQPIMISVQGVTDPEEEHEDDDGS